MIKNDYKVFNNYFVLYVTRRNGEIFNVYFDLDDFDFISELNSKIFVDYNEDTKDYYAKITKYLGKENGKVKYKGLLLHRLVMRVKNPKVVVDHKDFNTLDNRKDNLRIASHPQNNTHRKTLNINNKSGKRNVCWIKGCWKIQLQINGKNYRFSENFTDIEEAGRFAEEMRKKYYKEYR